MNRVIPIIRNSQETPNVTNSEAEKSEKGVRANAKKIAVTGITENTASLNFRKSDLIMRSLVFISVLQR